MINKDTAKAQYKTIADQQAWYAIGFEYERDAATGLPQIEVRFEGVPMTPVKDYVVGPQGIQLTEEPEAGLDLVIVRSVPFVQDIDFQMGTIDPEQIERGLDLSVERDQMLKVMIEEDRERLTADEELIAENANNIELLKTDQKRQDAEITQVKADVAKANTTAEKAVTTAEQAVTTAEQAVSTAEQAVATADDAVISAGHAQSTATDAAHKAVIAYNTANEAFITASDAESTASKAESTAAEAKSTADTAMTEVADRATKQEVKDAITAERSISDSKYLSVADSKAFALKSALDSVSAQVDTNRHDISDCKGDISALEIDKQDKLVAGDNITIEGNTISSDVPATIDKHVTFTAGLTTSELNTIDGLLSWRRGKLYPSYGNFLHINANPMNNYHELGGIEFFDDDRPAGHILSDSIMGGNQGSIMEMMARNQYGAQVGIQCALPSRNAETGAVMLYGTTERPADDATNNVATTAWVQKAIAASGGGSGGPSIQYDTFPEATGSGRIIQYTGPDGAATNGYFYKDEQVPGDWLEWEYIEEFTNGLQVTDIKKLQAYVYWQWNDIRPGDDVYIRVDSDTEAQITVYRGSDAVLTKNGGQVIYINGWKEVMGIAEIDGSQAAVKTADVLITDMGLSGAWTEIKVEPSELPAINSGTNGRVLTNNGTVAQWTTISTGGTTSNRTVAVVTSLPAQWPVYGFMISSLAAYASYCEMLRLDFVIRPATDDVTWDRYSIEILIGGPADTIAPFYIREVEKTGRFADQEIVYFVNAGLGDYLGLEFAKNLKLPYTGGDTQSTDWTTLLKEGESLYMYMNAFGARSSQTVCPGMSSSIYVIQEPAQYATGNAVEIPYTPAPTAQLGDIQTALTAILGD